MRLHINIVVNKSCKKKNTTRKEWLWHRQCSNLTEERWSQYTTATCNRILFTPVILKLSAYAVINERAHCTLLFCLEIYYAHFTAVRFAHSVYTSHFWPLIYLCITQYLYICTYNKYLYMFGSRKKVFMKNSFSKHKNVVFVYFASFIIQ